MCSVHPGFARRYKQWGKDPANVVEFDAEKFNRIHNGFREVVLAGIVGGMQSRAGSGKEGD